ncbi:Na+/H+ antiporter subunit E [Amycolatopsis alkalitolerans]|uniref:Na+/H+ antiporter subunit E n=1 Tax=Amycolatopsis alkalitolerans TaxID=2547244 RepID=UPI00135C2728|nr:Na+/H+ antiporter subunit E [Amycolatopsis alkalitolerans]
MEVGVWWAFLVVVWLATLNSVSVQEIVTAAVLAVPCAVVARTARRAAGLRWSIRLTWIRWLVMLPGAVIHDALAVLGLAARRRTHECHDEFRSMTLPRERGEVARAGQEAATVAVLSATPGSVVVDIDRDSGELLFHKMPIGRTRLERELSP